MGIIDRFKKKLAAEQKESIIQKASDSKLDLKKDQKQEFAGKREKSVAEKKEAKPAASEAKEVSKAKLLTKKPVSVHSQAYRILLRPVVTEKAAYLQAKGQYVFEVHPNTNKREVAKAVQECYGVTVVHVTMIVRGKRARRFGQRQGWTSAQKKAIVTLKKGESIELFESV